MQTVYYSTNNFIRHSGNVVDLAEYRRRMERSVVRVTEPFFVQEDERIQATAVPRARSRFRGAGQGLFLDFCASTAIVIMTAVAVVQFLIR